MTTEKTIANINTYESENFIYHFTDKVSPIVKRLAEIDEKALAALSWVGKLKEKHHHGVKFCGETMPENHRHLFTYATDSLSLDDLEKPTFYPFMVHEMMHVLQGQLDWFRPYWINEGFAEFAALKAMDGRFDLIVTNKNSGEAKKQDVLEDYRKLGLKPITDSESLNNYGPWLVDDIVIDEPDYEFSPEEVEFRERGYRLIYHGGMYIFLFMESFGKDFLMKFIDSLQEIKSFEEYFELFKKVFSMSAEEFENKWFEWMENDEGSPMPIIGEEAHINTYESENFTFHYTDKAAPIVQRLAEEHEKGIAALSWWAKPIEKKVIVAKQSGEIIPEKYRRNFTFSGLKMETSSFDRPSFYPFMVHEMTHVLQDQRDWENYSLIFEGFAEYTAQRSVGGEVNLCASCHHCDNPTKRNVIEEYKKLNLKPISNPESVEDYGPWHIDDILIDQPDYKFTDEDKAAIKRGYRMIYWGGMHFFLYIESLGNDLLDAFLKQYEKVETVEDYRNLFKKVFGMSAEEFENKWFEWMKN